MAFPDRRQQRYDRTLHGGPLPYHNAFDEATGAMVIKARFDGQVFVPEQPVDLPPGSVVEIALPAATPESPPLARLAEVLAQYPDDPDWPADGATRHDEHLYGESRRP